MVGCFLTCFGFSKKRKRRKPANKILSQDQGHGSYMPLDSDVTTKLDITENPTKPDSKFSDKGKERLSSRIKKKVSFNLNVKTYEPLPNSNFTSYFSESEEEKEEETGKASNRNNSEESKMGSYRSDYRYQNCRDYFDEEDDIKLEESDLDDDENDRVHDDDNDGDSNDSDDVKMTQEEFSQQLPSLSMESEKRVNSAQLTGEKVDNFVPLSCSLDQELKKPGLNHKAQRDRSQYVFSVLNPVENLSQWKAVKAKAKQALKQQRKENIALEQEEQIPIWRKPFANPSNFKCKSNSNRLKAPMQDIAVDASLSNWLCTSSS